MRKTLDLLVAEFAAQQTVYPFHGQAEGETRKATLKFSVFLWH